MTKPKLDKVISLKDFKDYYWLKEELTNFCREIGINRTGGKLDISRRIEKYLETGEIVTKSESVKRKPISRFDWNKEELDLNTVITDNYRNTENVRAFFKKAIGTNFKFNVEFINWMKSNTGKTLRDAVIKWIEISEMKKDKSYKTDIAPQFEYNTYIRDFLNDNPGLTTKDAMTSWKIKRNTPGSMKYSKEDLEYLDFT